jgi:hypothetical protein
MMTVLAAFRIFLICSKFLRPRTTPFVLTAAPVHELDVAGEAMPLQETAYE